MDTEKVKQLADNVNKLIAVHKEREENIKKHDTVVHSRVKGVREVKPQP